MGRWWASMTGALMKSSSHEIFHLVRHIKDSFCGCSANWTEWNQSPLLLLRPSHKSWVWPPPDPPNHHHHHPCGACRLWASSLFFHPGSAGTQGQGHSTEPSSDCLKLKYTCFGFLFSAWNCGRIFLFFCFLFLNQLLSKLFFRVSAAVIEAEHVWSTNMFSLLFCDQRFFFIT